MILEKLRRYFGGFEFAVFDEAKKQRWIVPSAEKSMGYLKAMNAAGKHVFLRPMSDREARFMLADDLTPESLSRHREGKGFRAGRMVVETSPNNFQVWIRADRDLDLSEKRYWLKRMGSDPGAAPRGRFGRAPGFRNRKEKYRDESGGFPLARLLWIDWRTDARVSPLPISAKPLPIPWKGGECAIRGEITRARYDRGDESATDFAYALALMRRGMDDDAVMTRISLERENWVHHEGDRRRRDYLTRTVRRARAVVVGGAYV